MVNKRPVGKCGKTLYMTEVGQKARAGIYYCRVCEGNHLLKDKKPKKKKPKKKPEDS